MKWLTAAILGYIIGLIVFAFVWALIVSTFAKSDEDRKPPPWPAKWAMGIAFLVVALSSAGFFREVIPLRSIFGF